eukprot:8813158-Pyramimonas_sp.AAC.1
MSPVSCGPERPPFAGARGRARERQIGTGGLAALEQESATLKTKQDYQWRLARFDDICRIHGLETETDAGFEEAL